MQGCAPGATTTSTGGNRQLLARRTGGVDLRPRWEFNATIYCGRDHTLSDQLLSTRGARISSTNPK